ncbi:hypothetical protein [Candidatus Vidania fulgoroideorum]
MIKQLIKQLIKHKIAYIDYTFFFKNKVLDIINYVIFNKKPKNVLFTNNYNNLTIKKYNFIIVLSNKKLNNFNKTTLTIVLKNYKYKVLLKTKINKKKKKKKPHHMVRFFLKNNIKKIEKKIYSKLKNKTNKKFINLMFFIYKKNLLYKNSKINYKYELIKLFLK